MDTSNESIELTPEQKHERHKRQKREWVTACLLHNDVS